MSEGNRGPGPEIPSFMFDKEKREPPKLVYAPKNYDFIIEETKNNTPLLESENVVSNKEVTKEKVEEKKGTIKFAGVKRKLADGSFTKADLI